MCGAERAAVRQLQCDMLIQNKDRVSRNVLQSKRRGKDPFSFGIRRADALDGTEIVRDAALDQRIAWINILGAKGLPLKDTQCHVSVFSVDGQAGETQHSRFCKAHPRPYWNEEFEVKLASDSRKKKLQAAVESLRHIMQTKHAKKPLFMVICEIVNKNVLGTHVVGKTISLVEEGGAAIYRRVPLELQCGRCSGTMSLEMQLWAGKRGDLDKVLVPLRSTHEARFVEESKDLLDRLWTRIEKYTDGAVTRAGPTGEESKVSVAETDVDALPSGPCELSIKVKDCSDLMLSRAKQHPIADDLYIAVMPCPKVFMRTKFAKLEAQNNQWPAATKFNLLVNQEGVLGLAFGELRRDGEQSRLRVVSVDDRGLAARDPRMVPGVLLLQINDESMLGKTIAEVARTIKSAKRDPPLKLTFEREGKSKMDAKKGFRRFDSSVHQLLLPSVNASGNGNHNEVHKVMQITVFLRKPGNNILNLDADPALQVCRAKC